MLAQYISFIRKFSMIMFSCHSYGLLSAPMFIIQRRSYPLEFRKPAGNPCNMLEGFAVKLFQKFRDSFSFQPLSKP